MWATRNYFNQILLIEYNCFGTGVSFSENLFFSSFLNVLTLHMDKRSVYLWSLLLTYFARLWHCLSCLGVLWSWLISYSSCMMKLSCWSCSPQLGCHKTEQSFCSWICVFVYDTYSYNIQFKVLYTWIVKLYKTFVPDTPQLFIFAGSTPPKTEIPACIGKHVYFSCTPVLQKINKRSTVNTGV